MEGENDSLRYNYTCSVASQMYPLYGSYAYIMIASVIADYVIMLGIIPLNFLVVLIIIKNRKLQIPANLCMACTAVCDFFIGCFSMPIFTANFWLAYHRQHNCQLYDWMYSLIHYFAVTSFVMVIMMITDRYLAIVYPFKYHKIHNKQYICAIMVMWLAITSFITTIVLTNSLFILMMFEAVVFFGAIFFATFVYFKIRMKITLTRKRIKQTTIQKNQNDFRVRKNSSFQQEVLLFLMVGSIVACYIPQLICVTFWMFLSDSDWIQALNMWGFFSASLKSLVNPLVYCYSLRRMRRAMKMLLGIRLKIEDGGEETTKSARIFVTEPRNSIIPTNI